MWSVVKWVLLGCFAGPSWAFAQMEVTYPFVHEQTYVLPSGKKVELAVRERYCKRGECREVDAGMWGMDGGVPRFVTETFLIRINGRPFPIPVKLYTDLTNTHSATVVEDKERVIVQLKGGSGAGAYTARFALGGMCGFERKICGEVCDELWEHTTWYNSFSYEGEPFCESGIE
jgi:hypothetical protein